MDTFVGSNGKNWHQQAYLANEQSGNLFFFREQRQVMAHQQYLVRYEDVSELIQLFIHDCGCAQTPRPITHDTDGRADVKTIGGKQKSTNLTLVNPMKLRHSGSRCNADQ